MLVDSTVSAELAEVLPGAVTWEPRVSSWIGGRFLADVPVESGRVVWSSKRAVPGSLDLTVPRWWGGVDWRPDGDHDHPLAAKGQALRVSLVVGSPSSGQSWVIQVGTLVIVRTEAGPGVVRVTGQSMMLRVERGRLTSPMAPRSGGTLASEARRLLPESMGLSVDGALTDRACPAMSWGESRIGALQEIADAWPARLREDRYGDAWLLPPLADVPTPVDTLTDGERGTVVEAYGDDDSSGVFNVVVARGQETSEAGTPTIQAMSVTTDGPYWVGRFGDVPFFMSSPLLTSTAAAQSAADGKRAELVRQARTVPVTLAPDPRWDVDDAVAVVSDGVEYWGYISGVDLPLTPADGDMRIDVEVA